MSPSPKNHGPDDSPTGDPIQLALDRNVPFELQFRAIDGELIVLKSRVLGTCDGKLELDMPQSIGHEIDFQFGLEFDGHFAIGDTRYLFRSRIRNLTHQIELNSKKRLVGIEIDYPTNLRKGQRRNDHRVLLDHSDPRNRITSAITIDGAIGSPIDGAPVPARISDLSTGGCALVLSVEDGRQFQVNDLACLELHLSDLDAPLVCLLEVRQVRELPRSGGYRIGWKLKTWPNRRHIRRWQQTVQHHLSVVQRERTRQRRSA